MATDKNIVDRSPLLSALLSWTRQRMQRAKRLGYDVEFIWPDDISSNPALACSFFSSEIGGRITMWESGHCEIEVLSASDSSEILCQSHIFEHENRVAEAFSRFDAVVFG